MKKRKHDSLDTHLDRLRFTGNKGTPILMHRSLRRLNINAITWVAIILLPLYFDILLWFNLDKIMSFWASIYDFWINAMGLHAQVLTTDINLFFHIFSLPYPALATSLPSHSALFWNVVVCVVLYIFTIFLPKHWMPMNYLLRAAFLIQISASVYFWCFPDRDPYPLPSYFEGMFTVGCYFLFLAPVVLALVYYIFDFELWRKFLITVGVLGYFILFMPFQYLLHAMIMSSGTSLFTPVLYLLFGPLLNVLLMVFWYSFAMTWNQEENQQPNFQ